MGKKKIQAVLIEPDSIPVPTWIDDDLIALNRAVNINWRGQPHPDVAPFEISEIKDGINIISSPKGEERRLPLTRTVGRYSKFYGIIYLVKMKGFDLVSMTDKEVIHWCMKFLDDVIPIENLGLPPIDYGDDDGDDDDDRATNYCGRIDITFDDW